MQERKAFWTGCFRNMKLNVYLATQVFEILIFFLSMLNLILGKGLKGIMIGTSHLQMSLMHLEEGLVILFLMLWEVSLISSLPSSAFLLKVIKITSTDACLCCQKVSWLNLQTWSKFLKSIYIKVCDIVLAFFGFLEQFSYWIVHCIEFE